MSNVSGKSPRHRFSDVVANYVGAKLGINDNHGATRYLVALWWYHGSSQEEWWFGDDLSGTAWGYPTDGYTQSLPDMVPLHQSAALLGHNVDV